MLQPAITILYCIVFKYQVVCVSDTSAENVTESIVAEGLVEVRRGGLKPNEYVINTHPYRQRDMFLLVI